MAKAKKKTTKKAAAKKTTKKAAKKKTTKKAAAKKATKKVAKKKTTKKAAKKKVVKKTTKKAVAKKKTTKKAAAKKTTKKAVAKKTTKKAAKKTKKKRKPNAAFMAPLQPSATLGEVIGDKPIPRTEVIKKIWIYIKKHDLQDKKNRRNINGDAKLKKLFGKNQVSMFELTKIVSKHLNKI